MAVLAPDPPLPASLDKYKFSRMGRRRRRESFRMLFCPLGRSFCTRGLDAVGTQALAAGQHKRRLANAPMLVTP
jgi:hypothetical protein